jgi:hypothetical protein
MVPERKKGSWGMAFMVMRTAERGMLARERSSMKMFPDINSSMRKSERMREDLPLPLRPQMPSFSPGWMVRVKDSRALLSTVLQMSAQYLKTYL